MITLFRTQIQPAPQGAGFAMDGYWDRCGSPTKGEDVRCHLFAYRWPKLLPLSPNWVCKSKWFGLLALILLSVVRQRFIHSIYYDISTKHDLSVHWFFEGLNVTF